MGSRAIRLRSPSGRVTDSRSSDVHRPPGFLVLIRWAFHPYPAPVTLVRNSRAVRCVSTLEAILMATEADDSIEDCFDDVTRGDHSATSPLRAARGKLAGGRGPAADEESEADPEGGIADELECAPRTVANRPGLIRSLRAGAGES
jgi:hypothetical protein